MRTEWQYTVKSVIQTVLFATVGQKCSLMMLCGIMVAVENLSVLNQVEMFMKQGKVFCTFPIVMFLNVLPHSLTLSWRQHNENDIALCLATSLESFGLLYH